MATLAPTVNPSTDSLFARNSTKVYLAIQVPGKAGYVRVGRVQSMREDINNNVQVLSELGRDFAVELKKGVTTYTFTIAKFYVRRDVFDDIKSGLPFSLQVRDAAGVDSQAGTGGAEVLELFRICALSAVSRDITIGQATIAENATVVVAGLGITGQPSPVAAT